MRTKPNKKAGEQNSVLIPIWFRFSARFYRRLAAIAQECDLTEAEVIKKGICLVLKKRRDSLAEIEAKTPVGLSVHRWLRVPKDERSRMSREMARKRWAKTRRPALG